MSMVFLRNDFINKARKDGHSTDFLKATTDYAENLTAKGFPVIFDMYQLSSIFDIDWRTFSNLYKSYKYFSIKKKSGGKRRIVAPYRNLRKMQEWVKKSILDKVKIEDCINGFAFGRSIATNAKVHENQKYILNFDLKDFFESINSRRIYGLFRWMGYEKEVAGALTSVCTTKIDEYKLSMLPENEQTLFEDLVNKKEPFLVQGSPTSPVLSNLICHSMDKRFMALALKNMINYSRYADDITFSSNDIKTLPSRATVKRIIEDNHFKLNELKTCLCCSGQRQMVTGLLVDGKVRVRSAYKRDVWRHIHFCRKFGAEAHFSRVSKGANYSKQWLEGRVLFIYSVEPEVGKKMMEVMKDIEWGI